MSSTVVRFLLRCVALMLQGEGLQLLLNEGAEKNSWPKSFAATHKFKSDPVIPLPDVTMVDFDRDLDEFLVVATDGLWDCMPPAEAIRYARWVGQGDLPAAACALAGQVRDLQHLAGLNSSSWRSEHDAFELACVPSTTEVWVLQRGLGRFAPCFTPQPECVRVV